MSKVGINYRLSFLTVHEYCILDRVLSFGWEGEVDSIRFFHHIKKFDLLSCGFNLDVSLRSYIREAKENFEKQISNILPEKYQDTHDYLRFNFGVPYHKICLFFAFFLPKIHWNCWWKFLWQHDLFPHNLESLLFNHIHIALMRDALLPQSFYLSKTVNDYELTGQSKLIFQQ